MYENLLRPDAIRLGLTSTDAADAVVQCGHILTGTGAVTEPYVAAMLDRARTVPAAIGRGVALPHGVGPARQHVRRTALALAQFPDGVDWWGESVSVCVAIACREDEPVGLISLLTRLLLDERQSTALRAATDPDEVFALLRNGRAELTGAGDDGPAPVPSFEPSGRRSTTNWARLAYPPVPAFTAAEGG